MRRMCCAAASENIITLRTLADADMVVTAETPLVRIWACTACFPRMPKQIVTVQRRMQWRCHVASKNFPEWSEFFTRPMHIVSYRDVDNACTLLQIWSVAGASLDVTDTPNFPCLQIIAYTMDMFY